MQNSIKSKQHEITLTLCINQFLILDTFSFLFIQTSFVINSMFEPCTAVYLLLATFHFISEFLFFGTFWDFENAGYRD